MNSENIAEAQIKSLKILLQATQDPEWIVRYAAIVGLQGLANTIKTQQPESFEQVIYHLKDAINTDETLAVQARAKLAQQSLMQ